MTNALHGGAQRCHVWFNIGLKLGKGALEIAAHVMRQIRFGKGGNDARTSVMP